MMRRVRRIHLRGLQKAFDQPVWVGVYRLPSQSRMNVAES